MRKHIFWVCSAVAITLSAFAGYEISFAQQQRFEVVDMPRGGHLAFAGLEEECPSWRPEGRTVVFFKAYASSPDALRDPKAYVDAVNGQYMRLLRRCPLVDSSRYSLMAGYGPAWFRRRELEILVAPQGRNHVGRHEFRADRPLSEQDRKQYADLLELATAIIEYTSQPTVQQAEDSKYLHLEQVRQSAREQRVLEDSAEQQRVAAAMKPDASGISYRHRECGNATASRRDALLPNQRDVCEALFDRGFKRQELGPNGLVEEGLLFPESRLDCSVATGLPPNSNGRRVLHCRGINEGGAKSLGAGLPDLFVFNPELRRWHIAFVWFELRAAHRAKESNSAVVRPPPDYWEQRRIDEEERKRREKEECERRLGYGNLRCQDLFNLTGR
jgi:hypothetical protein